MRILFVRLSSFGDVVFAMPAARAIAEHVPGAELAWAVEEPLAPLLEGAPWVRRVFKTRTKAWRRTLFGAATRRDVAAFLAEARAFRPDVIVDAQGLFKSAWVTLLVPAPRKVGFGPKTATERVNCLATAEHIEAKERSHAVDRTLAFAEHLTGRAGFDRIPDVRHLVGREDPEVDAWLSSRASRPFALLQPFASTPEKEWDRQGVLAFARVLSARGLDAVVRWGPGERERADALAASSSGVLSVGPPTTPSSSARLSAAARLFVGADTGPTHLAAAAGAPTLALFGPTPPARFAPVGPRTAFLEESPGDYNRSSNDAVRWPLPSVLEAVRRLGA